jgi:hypothetical protein
MPKAEKAAAGRRSKSAKTVAKVPLKKTKATESKRDKSASPSRQK